MGKLLWSKWARLIALTAGVFEIIGGIFGIVYRLSLYDVLTRVFNPLILKFNYFAIFCIIFGLIVLMLEYPLPQLKESSVANNYHIKIVLYFFLGAMSTINYQNVDPGFYLIFASLMYAKALMNDENTEIRRMSLSSLNSLS